MTTWSLQDITIKDAAGHTLSLKSYGVGIERGSLITTIPRKGQNLEVPHREGTRWRVKTPDEVNRDVEVWIHGVTEDGSSPATYDARIARLNANIMAVTSILSANHQIEVTRDILLPDPDVGVLATKTLTVKALGEVVDAADIEYDDDFADLATLRFTMTFPNPYWFGTEESVSGSSGTITATNVGVSDVWWPTIEIDGPATNPRINNLSIGSGDVCYILYSGTVPSGSTLEIGAGWCEMVTSGGDRTSVIGNLTKGNTRQFLRLKEGDNSLQLVNGGTFTVRWQPYYI